ncbi:MAG: hypothetical protein ACRDYX_19845 [Egibacteraceae bacterium]
MTALQPVADAQQVAAMIEVAKAVHAAQALRRYIVDLVRASRAHPAIELGASPPHRYRAAPPRTREGRRRGARLRPAHDVKALAHRLALSPQAQMADRSAVDIMTSCSAT